MLKRDNEKRTGHGTVTLADVARASNVSQITVSRVIRNKGPVAPETRERVISAIEGTGYIPNLLAGSLASAGSQLIGVIVPSLGNIVFPDVLRGLAESVQATSYRTVVAVSDYDKEEEGRLISSILSWRPAALIVTGMEQSPLTARQLRATKAHVAQITDIDAEPINVAIGISHLRAGREMAQHLMSRGYRRFGFVGHDLVKDGRANKRYMSFRSTLAEGGASFVGESIILAPSKVPLGKQGLAELLAAHDGIDAVLFSNDEMAVGGYFHCLEHGIDIPSQLALAGFNGLDVGQALPKPLTTAKTRWVELGRRAGQAVIDMINGVPMPPIVDVGFEMVAGATS